MHRIEIAGPIGREPGEVSAAYVRAQLELANGPVELVIDSEGGVVFEGFAIYDAIQAHPHRTVAKVYNAFSIASVVALACGEVEIAENGYFMVHSPHMDEETTSDSDEKLLKQLNDRMVSIYAERTCQHPRSIRELMQAESFLDATLALSHGFANRIAEKANGRPLHEVKAKFRQIVASHKPVTVVDAKAEWTQALKAVMARGIHGSKAMVAVDRLRPGLREKMLAEANKPKAKTVVKPGAKAEWSKQVKAKMDAGLPRNQAMVEVDDEFPGLRQQMIREANATRR